MADNTVTTIIVKNCYECILRCEESHNPICVHPNGNFKVIPDDIVSSRNSPDWCPLENGELTIKKEMKGL